MENYSNLKSTLNADQSITATLPAKLGGGRHIVRVLRAADKVYSNPFSVWAKPWIDKVPEVLYPEKVMPLTGQAFVKGAVVLINGKAAVVTTVTETAIAFLVPKDAANVKENEWLIRCGTRME